MKLPQDKAVSVIIVVHDSQLFIHKVMNSLKQQTLPPHQIIIVDSGSKDMGYLSAYEKDATIIRGGVEIGFCRANNIGMKHLLEKTDYVFFLNPDAFPSAHFLAKAVEYLEDHPSVGAVTGPLLGYAIQKKEPSGTYDSTGVFTTWYGKWYDRGQGKPSNSILYQSTEVLPAICGAAFFARKKALDQILIRGEEVFDSTFFMYKEDIDLSLRLRKKGWELHFVPELIGYHCRGWNRNRKEVPRLFRLASVKNEWKIHWKEKAPVKIVYSSLKWVAVALFDY
jgi:N-acetylglucosaminyl-diphospho-decaprenol L-rhamnosyltransferase